MQPITVTPWPRQRVVHFDPAGVRERMRPLTPGVANLLFGQQTGEISCT